MKSKKVLVSQRIDYLSDRDEFRDSVDQKLILFLVEVGLKPFIVPNIFDKSSLLDWASIIIPDGIVLSGGNDLGEFPQRDSTERYLLEFAEQKKLPAWGVCRGMQMMAHYRGSELVHIQNHVKTNHEIILLEDQNLPSKVNSFHSKVIKSCPPGFSILAESLEGYIEAIRNPILNWEGWMWHPERESSFRDVEILRLRRLFGLSF